MTMAGARSITVDGKAYPYVLRRQRLAAKPDWTVRLVIEFRPKKFKTCVFRFQQTTLAGSNQGFTPALVGNVIKTLELHQGELPAGFMAGAWTLQPSVESVQQPQG